MDLVELVYFVNLVDLDNFVDFADLVDHVYVVYLSDNVDLVEATNLFPRSTYMFCRLHNRWAKKRILYSKK